jgi:hypothetical protein
LPQSSTIPAVLKNPVVFDEVFPAIAVDSIEYLYHEPSVSPDIWVDWLEATPTTLGYPLKLGPVVDPLHAAAGLTSTEKLAIPAVEETVHARLALVVPATVSQTAGELINGADTM